MQGCSIHLIYRVISYHFAFNIASFTLTITIASNPFNISTSYTPTSIHNCMNGYTNFKPLIAMKVAHVLS